MPPTRSQPLNPHVAAIPVARRAQPMPPAAAPQPPDEHDPVEVSAAAARAGGFHESSYELSLGLEVRESEWPDDTTMPGKLGER